MHVSKATAVIVQRIPAADIDWYLEWQRGVAADVGNFPGYRGTEVYPPPGGREGEWVVVVNFESEESLQAWLDSPLRKHWVDELQARIGTFDLNVLPGGFAAWFSKRAQAAGAAPPPAWKMALIVLLGLYPTVMLLNIFPGPYTSKLGLAVSMLIGNALSVSILQWVVMPVLNMLSASWLQADPVRQRLLNRAGVGVIVALLVVLAILFHGVTG